MSDTVVRPARGFYTEETDGVDRYRWMTPRARLKVTGAPSAAFLEMQVFSNFHNLGQTLRADADGTTTELDLAHGWNAITIPVTVPGDVDLAVDPPFPRRYYPDDTLTLTVRVTSPMLHTDRRRHEAVARQHDNLVRNTREMLAGDTVLESTAPHLGIDVSGRCNVDPPCVFCDWHKLKREEGSAADRPFRVEELGELYANAARLVNCSIGEPFMMPDIPQWLETFHDDGKVLEMSTNGQILPPKAIDAMLGRDIHLYVSLEAATAETYSRLRNDRFPVVMRNLRRLVEAKGGRGSLPRVYLVFMPMRCNMHELDEFVRLCADLPADQLVLRPLDPSPSIELDTVRAGHRFRYQDQLLSLADHIRLAGRAQELCRRMGVPLADQLDFGGASREWFDELFQAGRRSVGPEIEEKASTASPKLGTGEETPSTEAGEPVVVDSTYAEADESVSLGEEQLPLCTEPWRNWYVLRRGTMPCCYGEAIAGVEGCRQTWNDPMVQEMRRELAAGRFPRYCLNNLSCPLVTKQEKAHRLSRWEGALRPARRQWRRLNRVTGGFPSRLIRRPRRMLHNLHRRS